ncbi:MAG: sodium:calcium antiporter [Armatimonadota bacterium]
MLLSIVLLIVSLGMILAGAELFTNGIEWFGKHLKLAEGAVGSVLAAVGTAMPETMIPIIAILFGSGKGSHDIGVGAILGAPLMLSTLAMFVTGLAVIIFAARKCRTQTVNVNPTVLGRDLRTFFLVYSVAIASAFLPGRPYKIVAAIFLVGAYVYYVRQTFCCVSTSEGHSHQVGPLHFHKVAETPRLRIVLGQVLFALLLIVLGAHLFVKNLEVIAIATGISGFIFASIIAPIATELPEKFNSVTWIRQRKDTLALGNISGAMVFQSSIPPAIGILFTPWVLNPQALAAGLVAIAATVFAWAELSIKKRLSPYTLLFGIVFYIAYILYIFVFSHHS